MISEDGLVLCSPDLPLEPGLWLPVVRDLQGSGSVADLWQVRHGVPHCDSSVDSSVTPEAERVTGIRTGDYRPRGNWEETFESGYRVTLLTYFLSSTTTLREQARGANTCSGSG